MTPAQIKTLLENAIERSMRESYHESERPTVDAERLCAQVRMIIDLIGLTQSV